MSISVPQGRETLPRAEKLNPAEILAEYNRLKMAGKKPQHEIGEEIQRKSRLSWWQTVRKIFSSQKIGLVEAFRLSYKFTIAKVKNWLEQYVGGYEGLKAKAALAGYRLMEKVSPRAADRLVRSQFPKLLSSLDDPKNPGKSSENKLYARVALTTILDTCNSLPRQEKDLLLDSIGNFINFKYSPKKEAMQELKPEELTAMGSLAIKILYRLKEKSKSTGELEKILLSLKALSSNAEGKTGAKKDNDFLGKMKQIFTANGKLLPEDIVLRFAFPSAKPEELQSIRELLQSPLENIPALVQTGFKTLWRMRNLLTIDKLKSIYSLYHSIKKDGFTAKSLATVIYTFKEETLVKAATAYTEALKDVRGAGIRETARKEQHVKKLQEKGKVAVSENRDKFGRVEYLIKSKCGRQIAYRERMRGEKKVYYFPSFTHFETDSRDQIIALGHFINFCLATYLKKKPVAGQDPFYLKPDGNLHFRERNTTRYALKSAFQKQRFSAIQLPIQLQVRGMRGFLIRMNLKKNRILSPKGWAALGISPGSADIEKKRHIARLLNNLYFTASH